MKKKITLFIAASLSFVQISRAETDYTQYIYEFLTSTLNPGEEYKSLLTFFDSWYEWADQYNYFQKLNTPTALFTVYDSTGSRAYDVTLTYAQYLDYLKVNSDLIGYTIRPDENRISEFIYASNDFYRAGGATVTATATVTNNLTFTLEDFLGVIPVPGDYSYLWSEWIQNLINPHADVTEEMRWQSYRHLKASRELQENLDMLTGGGLIGSWQNNYSVENWNDIKHGTGYDVQNLLKNAKSGDGTDLIGSILDDWGLSPTEKANLITHAVQGGQRNLISDIKDNLQKIVEDGVKVSNTNEFPWSGEGGGGGIALPSDFFSAFSNLNDNVSNINTQQNERVDKYAVYWRGNLSVLEGLMETTKSGVDTEFSNHINSISNKFYTSKNLLSSLWLNPNFSSFESQLNQMLRVLAVYECPEKVLIYKLDGISNWLYSFGLISIAESIRDKDISIDMNTEFEVFNGSISWKKIVDTMRIFFIVFYCLWGWYVFCRFIIFLTASFIHLLHFVQKMFASIVQIFK